VRGGRTTRWGRVGGITKHRVAEKHDAGVRRTGDLQMRPRKAGGVGPRKPPSDGAPIGLVAVVRLALRTPPPTRDAFSRTPMDDSQRERPSQLRAASAGGRARVASAACARVGAGVGVTPTAAPSTRRRRSEHESRPCELPLNLAPSPVVCLLELAQLSLTDSQQDAVCDHSSSSSKD
jgi:hypothetical protein